MVASGGDNQRIFFFSFFFFPPPVRGIAIKIPLQIKLERGDLNKRCSLITLDGLELDFIKIH